MKGLIILPLFVLCFGFVVDAQEGKTDWDVNNPQGDWNWKDVEFTTDEGTWMNLDVSPDGKSIVFDMLGDIYIMSANGGKAEVIRSGVAWEVQPRFSPDGQKILFTSDAGGADNCWIMEKDGSEAKEITKEDFRLLNNGIWTPDGQYIIARKHFTSQRSLGAGEMWMYHITGGKGSQLTERKNDQQDVNEPSISPDGRYLFYSEDVYPGGFFQYNKDPNDQIFVIKRYDLEKGETQTILRGPGGAFRPEVSPDGKSIAYIKRIRTQTVLCVYDRETGAEKVLFDGLIKDQQEAWTIFGIYPGFDWTPDSESIVIYGNGKIWKVNANNGEASNIPFEVNVKSKVAETLQFKNTAFEKDLDVHVIRHLVTSPDEKMVVFNAVGYLWKKSLPDGKPERLTQAEDFEFEPSFSPDGKSIAYVTWDDEKMGKILIMNLTSGVIDTLVGHPGIYRTPTFSNDGDKIVYRKDGGNGHQGFVHCKEPGLYLIDLKSKTNALITPNGEFPLFNPSDDRIFYQTGGYLFGSLTKSVESVNLNGDEKREHFVGKHTQRYVISPDHEWVAWTELYKVFIAPYPKTGQKVGLTSQTKAVPVAQVSRDAGINLHWSSDSKSLHWTLGETYFTDDLTDRFEFLTQGADSLPPMDSVGINIGLVVESDKPEGCVALTNARIITMNGDEVIENGHILIEDNVITKVGAKVKIPSKAKVIDCSGKTIMPGLIDVHAHSGNFRYGLSPQKQWEYYANLAYGVTTSHDPSANSEMVFAQSELIKAGKMVGPRLFSTGTILYGADGDFKAVINGLEDAKSAIRRTKAYGAFSVKSYNQPRRNQRQQVIEAARQLGILVVPEGGSFFYHNMSMVADGHTGVEHNIPVAPLYKDVLKFWSASKSHNTPTLVVSYGAVNGEYYWYDKTNVWEKERLLSFTPRPIVDSRSRHRMRIPDEEYENGHILISESLKKLTDAGVKVNLGSHGQLQGLAAHWELWMFEQGGMSSLEALKCATINGAEYLGLSHQIGSLEKGKLADLIVIDGNPLEDIRQTENVLYTMVNGRLYNAATMDEVGNYDRKRSSFYFEREGSSYAYPVFGPTNSFLRPVCCQ